MPRQVADRMGQLSSGSGSRGSRITIKTRRRLAGLFWALLGMAMWLTALHRGYRVWFQRGTDSTWEAMQRTGRVRVCIDPTYPPFAYVLDSGGIAGFDVDLAEELASRFGVAHELVALHFDGLDDALLAGRCDIILSALPYDETLTEDVLYSPSYFNAGLLLAARSEDAAVRSTSDLAVRRVGVAEGSTAHLHARWLQEHARIPLVPVSYDKAEDALEALSRGLVDAVIADSIAVYGFSAHHDSVRYVQRFLVDDQYVIAMRPGDGYLWKRIADELSRMAREGYLERLIAKWF
jgi:ABC-type amino acid transport substrate-binding protein